MVNFNLYFTMTKKNLEKITRTLFKKEPSVHNSMVSMLSFVLEVRIQTCYFCLCFLVCAEVPNGHLPACVQSGDGGCRGMKK